MQAEIAASLKAAAKKLFNIDIEPEVVRPAEQLGDYATNIALKLGNQLNKKPIDVAEQLAAEIDGASVAAPGFINVRVTDATLLKAAKHATGNIAEAYANQEVLMEFGDQNPFKQMHIGHAYSYIVGDAISSLLEASGAKVQRLSYHGDVGLHVAKAIWGMRKAGVSSESLSDAVRQQIGMFYTSGARAYEIDANAKVQIDEINNHVYAQDDTEINRLYEWGKKESFGYFDELLKDLEINPTKRFLESQSAKKGEALVKANLGKVFEKSDGAVVFKGEKAGLHTRVFITSAGLPTYEAKDLGLAELKKEAYPSASRSIIVTAHEQAEYFKVMLAALAEIDKPTAESTTHLYHGFVSLSSGKMSSRAGDVYSALSLIEDVAQAVKDTFGKEASSTRNAAIKYGFLKHRLGSDIVYDVAESISLEGNSGPYLQYAHARACSILSKADTKAVSAGVDLDDSERSLARKIGEYPEIVDKAVAELKPHHICTYLYELAQTFNSFYETSRIIGSDRENLRLELAKNYRDVLAHGLNLLNIEAPEKV